MVAEDLDVSRTVLGVVKGHTCGGVHFMMFVPHGGDAIECQIFRRVTVRASSAKS